MLSDNFCVRSPMVGVHFISGRQDFDVNIRGAIAMCSQEICWAIHCLSNRLMPPQLPEGAWRHINNIIINNVLIKVT